MFTSLGGHVRLYGSLLVLFLSFISLLCLFPDSSQSFEYLGFSQHLKTDNISHNETALQYDPPPEQPPYGALVIAAQTETDTSWVEFARGGWDIYEYDTANPENDDPDLRFPKNKGHEAMVYLSFIIDNYDDLPWCTIFTHGHREAWHQEDDILKLINDLRRVPLARRGYISLRCEWSPSCPAEIRPIHRDSAVSGDDPYRKGTEAAIAGNWMLLFPGEKLPETIASPCCAQFAVTRQAIIRRPKEDYERLREWLTSSLLEDYLSGRVLEKLWAYLFTGEAVHCPAPEECACKWFGRCGKSETIEPAEGLGALVTFLKSSVDGSSTDQ